ncbi:MAG: NAD(P)(+) transhydrogenase (Re/Si-specific) subunit beta [Desulfobacterales bacterium]
MTAAKIVLFLLAVVCFVIGLKMLSRTETARTGNRVSAMGMLCAVLGALLSVYGDGDAPVGASFAAVVAAGLAVGGLAGAVAAQRVRMTAMPEMVALFNGFGGIASLLVAWAQFHHARLYTGVPLAPFDAATIYLAMLIGGVTFTGSLVAFGKLSGNLPGRPILYPGQNVVNGVVMTLLVAGLAVFTLSPDWYGLFLITAAIGLAFGIAVVIPIGGADMPVTISLLNSCSGLAACAAGFAVSNVPLIITGALVGASGIILTRIMCRAMNRSLANVLLSGFGSGAARTGKPGIQGEARSMTPQDAYYILEAAQNVVIIPGYGMAVAQAQHAVRELATHLENNGTEVVYAIHPVAGRMPGHMNVLLAEANVPYEQLVEMEAANPRMSNMDAAIVIGANDVVNPAAREEKDSPIYGMPIVDADRARTVFVLKRSMNPGFAGIENPLFFKDNTYMIFGDAKATLETLIAEFKDAS